MNVQQTLDLSNIPMQPQRQDETQEAYTYRVYNQFAMKFSNDYRTMKMQLKAKELEAEQVQEQHSEAINLIQEYEELLEPIHSLKRENKAKLKAEMVSTVAEAKAKLLQEERQKRMSTMSPVERLEFEFKEARESPEFERMDSLDKLKMMQEWKAKIKALKLGENAPEPQNNYDSPSPF